MVECITKSEVSEGDGKLMNWIVEVICESEVGQRREMLEGWKSEARVHSQG